MNGIIHLWIGKRRGIRTPQPLRSISAIAAGSSVSSATAHSRMPPPAMIPSSATPVKLVKPAAKKETAVVSAPVVIAGPAPREVSSRAGSQSCFSRAKLQVAGDVVDAVVDADADHRHGETDAEDVQMPDRQRDIAESPGHADQQDEIGQHRVAQAAETGNEQQADADHRNQAGPEHRRLAGVHFVGFHDRQAGQPDFGLGMLDLDLSDQLAQGGGRFVAGGEAAVFAQRQPQQHEAELSFLGQQIFAVQLAQHGERLRHVGKRRLVIRHAG